LIKFNFSPLRSQAFSLPLTHPEAHFHLTWTCFPIMRAQDHQSGHFFEYR
jgi:hypothetical protein